MKKTKPKAPKKNLSTEIAENVQRLYRLTDGLETFTLKEITARLEQESKKPLRFELFWGVQRYLEELRELNSLFCEDGRYFRDAKHFKPTPPRSRCSCC